MSNIGIIKKNVDTFFFILSVAKMLTLIKWNNRTHTYADSNIVPYTFNEVLLFIINVIQILQF